MVSVPRYNDLVGEWERPRRPEANDNAFLLSIYHHHGYVYITSTRARNQLSLMHFFCLTKYEVTALFYGVAY